MLSPTAGTTSKQLWGLPSFRSPDHSLLMAQLESAYLPQENGKPRSQIPAPSAFPLPLLSALCSPSTTPGWLRAWFTFQSGKEHSTWQCPTVHRTLTISGRKRLKEMNLATLGLGGGGLKSSWEFSPVRMKGIHSWGKEGGEKRSHSELGKRVTVEGSRERLSKPGTGQEGSHSTQREAQKGPKWLNTEAKGRQNPGLSPAPISAPCAPPHATPAPPPQHPSPCPQLPHLAAAALSRGMSAGVSALCH